MARRKKKILGPSQTQRRLQKELYQRVKANKRKKTRKKKKKKSFLSLFPAFHLNKKTYREMQAIFFVFLAFISGLALFGQSGKFGEFFLHYVAVIIGYGIYLLPLFFLAIAGKLFFFSEQARDSSKKAREENISHALRLYVGSFFFLAFLLGLFHVSVPAEMLQEVAYDKKGGGLVGFTVHFFFRPLFGDVGTFFLCLFAAIAFMLFAFNISLKSIYVFFKELLYPEKEEEIWQEKKIDKIIEKRSLIKNKEELMKSEKTKKKESNEKLTIRHYTVQEGAWEFPNLNLLEFVPFEIERNEEELEYNKAIIQKTLADFNIIVEMGEAHIGPTVTQYTFKPDAGTKLSKISGLQNDLALALAASSIRIEAPIAGKALVGIEIPNEKRATVKLRDLLESSEFNSIRSNLRLPLGRDINGKPMVADLAQMPHLLIAGSTGSGKSIGINTFLISLLYQNSPNDLKLILVDPKRVEMIPYNGIPHLLTPVITDATKTVAALRWAVSEMSRRYDLLASKKCRNIFEYNDLKDIEEKLSNIVIVIDELADLMMVASKEVEMLICRLAQMARAVGIHLIVATQRPSVDVVTGLIKANIPARVAFTVSTSHDSKTILDRVGADKLLGRGDMLYLPGNESKLYRIQGIFTDTKEVNKVIQHVKLTREPEYKEEILEPQVENAYSQSSDEREVSPTARPDFVPGLDSVEGDSDEDVLKQAIQVIQETQKASASFLQRRLRLGYSRAARIIDLLEERGYIGPANGSKPREVYMNDERE